MEPLFFWQVLRRRKRIVVFSFLIISLTAFIVAQWLPPSYSTKALIRYKKSDVDLSFLSGVNAQKGGGGGGGGGAAGAELKQTHIALATSMPVLERVTSRLQLRTSRGELMTPFTKSGRIQKRMKPGPFVSASAVSETAFIQIEGRSTDPDEAAMLANTIAEVFIELTCEQARQEYKSAQTFIESQINVVRATYLQTLEEIRNCRVAEGTVNLVKEGDAAIERMAILLQEKHTVTDDLAATLTEKTREHPDVAKLQVRLSGIQSEIDRQASVLSAIPKKDFTVSQLLSKLTINQSLYSSFLSYLQQVGIAQAMIPSDFRVVEEAQIPPGPKGKMTIYLMGIFMGAVCGLGLASLVERLDDSIRTPEDVKALGLTLLSTVPRFRARTSPLIIGRDPRDSVSEAYRALRNSIKFARMDKPVKTLLITSPMASEGKTTTVANLAISFSGTGKKVIIVDTDLRRPALHSAFGMSNEKGLMNVLADQSGAEDVIQATTVEGLSILASGPIPPDPARVIESEKMRHLIAFLTGKFDLVILDSPPILVANDAVILAGYVDGLISVIESGRETRAALGHENELLAHARIQPLGVVLNKFKIGLAGSYYDYYYYHKGSR